MPFSAWSYSSSLRWNDKSFVPFVADTALFSTSCSIIFDFSLKIVSKVAAANKEITSKPVINIIRCFPVKYMRNRIISKKAKNQKILE